MKNIFKFIGVIALAAVIGFSMTACGGDDDENDWTNGSDWYKWGDNITATVANDETITVNITQATGMDSCGIGVPYNGQINKNYIYKFDAWTKSGTRDVRVCFGSVDNDNGGVWYPNEVITLNTTRQTFELEYDTSAKWVGFDLGFNCGGEIGELSIKIISINEK